MFVWLVSVTPRAQVRPSGFMSRYLFVWVLLATISLSFCGDTQEAPPAFVEGAGETAAVEPKAQPSEAPRSENPLDIFIDKAGSYLASSQAEDGSWAYFHSQSADFVEPEPHANLFGTMMTLMNLKGTTFEASFFFERGAEYVKRRMMEGFTWSFYEPGQFTEDSWSEPDLDDTSIALTLLAGRLPITASELEEVRALYDRHRTAEGLYLTYMAGFFPEKGFVPDPNVPSLGVNLNVLGFFGKYGLERARLVEALRGATQEERYWIKTKWYRSLPILAYLASNAVEHGAPEAGELLRRFLADFAAEQGTNASFDTESGLGTLELAAYIKAQSHQCLLDMSPCRGLDPFVFELSKRRKMDGSWDTAPFYDYEINEDALVAFLERRDFLLRRESGGFGFDVERALASPGTVRYYDGSPAETTSFALKAIVFYRDLLSRRPSFSSPPPADEKK